MTFFVVAFIVETFVLGYILYRWFINKFIKNENESLVKSNSEITKLKKEYKDKMNEKLPNSEIDMSNCFDKYGGLKSK